MLIWPRLVGDAAPAGRDGGAGQVIADRVQVDCVFKPGRERGHGLVGVVAGAVEPPVHGLLHPAAHRAEQCRRGQRGGGHRHRRVDLEHLGGQQHQPGVYPDQQPGHDRVSQCPADDPADLVQPVLQDRHAHAHRQGSDADQEYAAHYLPAAMGSTGVGPGDKRGEGRGSPGHQPAELLAPLAGRAPPAHDLVANGKRPEAEKDQAQGLEDDRVLAVGQKEQPAGVHLGAVAGERVHRHLGLHDHVDHGKREISAYHPAPPRGRQSPVREQQDDQRDQPELGRRDVVQEQHHRTEREPVAEPVVKHVVKAAVGVEHEARAEDEHQPPDRVARPVPGEDQSHRHKGRRHHHDAPIPRSQRVLPDGERQRYLRDGKHQRQGGQDGRGHRGRQPGTSPPSPCRLPVAGGVCPLKPDVMPGPFRERYRSARNPQPRSRSSPGPGATRPMSRPSTSSPS